MAVRGVDRVFLLRRRRRRHRGSRNRGLSVSPEPCVSHQQPHESFSLGCRCLFRLSKTYPRPWHDIEFLLKPDLLIAIFRDIVQGPPCNPYDTPNTMLGFIPSLQEIRTRFACAGMHSVFGVRRRWWAETASGGTPQDR